MNRTSATILAVLLAVVQALPVVAEGHTVARVTDLAGAAGVEVDGANSGLRILARVREGARITLDPGATITLHFAATRTDYRFEGPASIVVGAVGAESESGAPAAQTTHESVAVSLDLENTDLGAILVRGAASGPRFTIDHPKRSVVISRRPVEFAWSGLPDGTTYQFSVTDDLGDEVFAATTTDTGVTLPADAVTRMDAAYDFRVLALPPAGAPVKRRGYFVTARAATEARYRTLEPLSAGSVSDRVLYGLLTAELGLDQESRRAFEALETERPGIVEQVD